MRIAFCGKGGSGKSTISSLFVRYLVHKHEDVLVVDGDINQHLGAALGLDQTKLEAQIRMGMAPEKLYDHVRGSNNRIGSTDHIIEPTPAGHGSGLIDFKGDDVLDHYAIKDQGLRFIALGGHSDEDVGATCYHKFTGAFGVFLNHLIDGQDDYLIGDMCAGADPFASSGLATRFDAVCLVVEPTLKSTGVYQQCLSYAKPHSLPIFVIGNKVEDADDKAFILEQIGQDAVIGFFEKSKFVKAQERGQFQEIVALETSNQKLLADLHAQIKALPPRDWDHFQRVNELFLKQAATGWADAMLGANLMDQIDPDFSYEKAANDILAKRKSA